MRVATIDIGTNTTLLLVAETRPGGELVAVREEATITRLGEGVDRTRTLAPAAIARTNACLDAYAEIVRAVGAERVAVVGTSAMRDAGGGEEVRGHVKARFGVEARTISGDEEARLTFRGARSGLERQLGGARVGVFDIGGGSTEVVVGEPDGETLAYAKSFDAGSVRLTERLVRDDPPSADELAALRASADAAFEGLPSRETLALGGPPVGIAGTMTTLAAIALKLAVYDGAIVHGALLATKTLADVTGELARLPLAERREVTGLAPKRADVIVAGGIVALALLDRLGAREVVISDRGVRWGLAEELVGTFAHTKFDKTASLEVK